MSSNIIALKKIAITLSSHGVDLSSIGTNNYAFDKRCALKFLDLFSNVNLPILGGDVYTLSKDGPRITYDNWYSEKEKYEDGLSFRNRSINEAKTYIKNYPNNKVYFSFVFDELSYFTEQMRSIREIKRVSVD